MQVGAAYFSLGLEHLASWRRLRSSREAVRGYQLAAIRRLTATAFRTPYYRERFRRAGIGPGDVRSWEDFARLPISDKADFQAARYEDRLSDGYREARGLFVQETSGSTGQVLRTAQTPGERVLYAERRLRAMMLSGLRPWSRRVHVASAVTRTAAHRLGLFRTAGVRLYDGPEAITARLEELRPDILKGPPRALELLVGHAPERLRGLGLKRVYAGAEQLTAKTRALVEDGFRARVVDFYGAVECNLIAWECERCGLYHTCDDALAVEVLRDGKPASPGEDGEVVVTALHSHCMPIVRYRIGDAACVPARPSECDIGFGVLERIEGRMVDYLDFGVGRPMSPYQLMDPLDAMKTVARYEIEQTARRAVVVRVEPAPGAAADAERVLREAEEGCRAVLPPGVSVSGELAEDLAPPPDRKRRFVRAYRGPD